MNGKLVYTAKLARHLQSKGFQFISKVPDIKKDNFINWVFEDTPELEEAISEYIIQCKNKK